MDLCATSNQINGLGFDIDQSSLGIESLLLFEHWNLTQESIDQFHHSTHGVHQTNDEFPHCGSKVTASIP